MWKPQTVLLSALSYVGGQSLCRSLCLKCCRRTTSLGIWRNRVDHRFVWRRFLAYQSPCAGPVLFREVWEECRRSWEFSCVLAPLCCNPQRSPLVAPMGFHFKSSAFVQKCVCSLILFGNYVKQKRMNGEENHSSSLPTLQPSPPRSLSLSLLCRYRSRSL